MKVIAYMNMPSFYQADFYRELSKSCDLLIDYRQQLAKERTELGWKSDYDGYPYRVKKNRWALEKEAFQFFSGFPGGLMNLYYGLISKKGGIAFQTEMPLPQYFTRKWRAGARLLSKIIRFKKAGAFAIGESTREFFRRIQIPDSQIFPWGYFPNNTSSNVEKDGECFYGPIVYSGQLIRRKGIDLLLKAYAQSVTERKRKVIIIGVGNQEQELKRIATKLHIDKQVEFVGAKSRNEVSAYLQQASCLVLPSRFDGWGVVINEAILHGTPAIVSTNCGAKELLQSGQCGIVIESENEDSLSNAFGSLYQAEEIWRDYSRKALDYRDLIAPPTVSKYFLDCVMFSQSGFIGIKPRAPWIGVNSMREPSGDSEAPRPQGGACGALPVKRLFRWFRMADSFCIRGEAHNTSDRCLYRCKWLAIT
jgi:glycosyltransferase involved in cell wall biosynthesis